MRSLLRGRRVSLSLLAVLILFLLAIVISHLVSFIHIFSTHAGIALTQHEVSAAHNATTPDPRPQLIPKIIHQIFHNWNDPGNETIPSDWDEQRLTCMTVNTDWEYKLWNESTSRTFIATEFPWFLATYDGYSYPVQRVDALRYFLMLRFGGIYLDLDNGCLQDLTPLLYYPVFVTDGGHGALSNNILGAAPGHPFWDLMTGELIAYDYNYLLPYVTISYASGQWFETAIWEKYHAQLDSSSQHPSDPADPAVDNMRTGTQGGGQLYRIMMDMRPGAAPWIFFTQGRGNSWRNWDYDMFGWIGDHIALVILGSVTLAIAMLWLAVRVYTKCRQRTAKRRNGYTRLANEGGENPRPQEVAGV